MLEKVALKVLSSAKNIWLFGSVKELSVILC